MSGEKLTVGQEVRVFDSGRYRKAPEDGWLATVVKVGRKYATAAYERQRTDWNHQIVTDRTEVEFDMLTGIERDTRNYGHRVLTPEQVDQDRRRKVALATLREHHVEFRLGHERSVQLAHLEALAEVVRTFTAESGD